jgi:hypothetical protein
VCGAIFTHVVWLAGGLNESGDARTTPKSANTKPLAGVINSKSLVGPAKLFCAASTRVSEKLGMGFLDWFLCQKVVYFRLSPDLKKTLFMRKNCKVFFAQI